MGSVVQATRMVEFEDGLWIGNQLKARNGLQRVRTIPRVQPGAVRTTGFQSAWVCVMAASIPSSCGVRIDLA